MPDDRLVHLVDDEESVRKSVGFLLKTSGYKVQAWTSGVSFLKEIRHAATGCVLLDLRMPGMDGLEVQAEMAHRGIAMPVVVLSGHGDVSTAVRAIHAGAVDFIEKPFDRDLLLAAISTAFDQLDDIEKHQTRKADALVQLAALTRREREVLKKLTLGFSNKAIADAFRVSPRTIEVHRANLMAKLGVYNFPDALRIAFTAGLDQEPSVGDRPSSDIAAA